MSGETEAAVSGWTVDTLHSHIAKILDDASKFSEARNNLLQEEMDRRLASMQRSIDDRRDDMKESLSYQIQNLRDLLDERYATQTKALDAAFRAAEQAVAVALANAEKATVKAEAAADKRFDSVNEFRKALTDQSALFLPRIEFDSAYSAAMERITTQTDRITSMESRLTSRLDLGEGQDAGRSITREQFQVDAASVQAEASAKINRMGLVIAAAVIVVNVIIFLLTH